MICLCGNTKCPTDAKGRKALARIRTDYMRGHLGMRVQTWVCSLECLAEWEEETRAEWHKFIAEGDK